ncbi:signal peptide peptidase SppA [Candidatus Dependentiae bacterium]|nr:signal peptide peptidase SppA [Candidatus Dependentiae bacterium]
MESYHSKKSYSFFNMLKNAFWVLLILQFAPSIIMNISKSLQETIAPRDKLGFMTIRGFLGDSSFYLKQLEKFAKADDIKGLLIKVDCHGGYPGSSQTVFKELQRFKEKKPVVVVVENVCASGGYYVACGATKIISSPAALVGNIGTIMQIPDVKGLMTELKVDMHHIFGGHFKAAGSPARTLTEEEKDYLQAVAHDDYQQFIKDVAQSRGLDILEEKVWADGKIIHATRAVGLNLIDQLGSYNDALTQLKKLAGIEGDVKLIKAKKPTDLMRYLVGEDDLDVEQSSFAQTTARFLSNVCSSFCTYQAVNNQKIIRS